MQGSCRGHVWHEKGGRYVWTNADIGFLSCSSSTMSSSYFVNPFAYPVGSPAANYVHSQLRRLNNQLLNNQRHVPQHHRLAAAGGPSGNPSLLASTSSQRLNEFFDMIRSEFESVGQDTGLLKAQRDEFEAKREPLEPAGEGPG